MSENRNQGMDQDRNSGMDNPRSSEGLGGQSQGSDSLQQGQQQDTSGQPQGIERSSVADYGSSGAPLDSGDSGRGGSAGSGRNDTGGMDDMDEEGLGHNRNGAAGM